MSGSFRPAVGVASAVVVAALGLAVPSTAAAQPAAVSCGTPSVPMYHVDASSQLRRWDYASPLDGSSGWTQQLIGDGWSGLTVVPGGKGVLFTIDSDGLLRWYKDNGYSGGGRSWDPATGSVIGSGWGGFRAVLGGGDGVLYVLDSEGNLFWFKYTGQNGSPDWAPNSGALIGTGWSSLTMVIPGGDGVLYAVDSEGTLWWYRHTDTANGSATWADAGIGAPIGSGWGPYTEVSSMGGGVLFARTSNGSLRWYRHLDPDGGSASWANNGIGTPEGTGWSASGLLTDVSGCSVSGA